MPTLTLHKLDPEVHRRLRMRAAEHGRSMEDEARAILEEVVAKTAEPPAGSDPGQAVAELQAWVDEVYGPNKPRSAVDELIAERRAEAAREEEEAREAAERYRRMRER